MIIVLSTFQKHFPELYSDTLTIIFVGFSRFQKCVKRSKINRKKFINFNK